MNSRSLTARYSVPPSLLIRTRSVPRRRRRYNSVTRKNGMNARRPSISTTESSGTRRGYVTLLCTPSALLLITVVFSSNESSRNIPHAFDPLPFGISFCDRTSLDGFKCQVLSHIYSTGPVTLFNGAFQLNSRSRRGLLVLSMMCKSVIRALLGPLILSHFRNISNKPSSHNWAADHNHATVCIYSLLPN